MIRSMKVTLETDRLLLRPFTIDDAEAVFEFGSNREVQKLTGDPLLQSLDEATNMIEEVWYEDYKTYGYGRFATIFKPDNKIIGFAGLKFLPELDETDIGFRFLPEYWGMGLATEASEEILKFGFETLGIQRIIGIAMPENMASRRVLEKIGLQWYKDGPYLDDGGSYKWYKLEK